MNPLENFYFSDDSVQSSNDCSSTINMQAMYNDCFHDNWPTEFSRLRKMWSYHSKFNNKLQKIPVYECSSKQRIALTSPCKLREILDFMFPSESINPSEWQLQLVKKNDTKVLNLLEKCECNMDILKEKSNNGYIINAIEENTKEIVNTPKDRVVKYLQTYTQYVEIAPERFTYCLPRSVKGITPKNSMHKPKKSKSTTNHSRISVKKSEKAKTNLSIQKLTEIEKRTVSFTDSVKRRDNSKCICVQTLFAPQNSITSLTSKTEVNFPINKPKKCCNYCQTIFEYLEKRKREPGIEPPNEYLQKVDDCPLCSKFLEFLKLQCQNVCCKNCRSSRLISKSKCCLKEKLKKKTDSKIPRPKIGLEQIRTIERNENKSTIGRITNKIRPKTAESSRTTSKRSVYSKCEVISPLETNIRRNLERMVSQNFQLSVSDTQSEIEDHKKTHRKKSVLPKNMSGFTLCSGSSYATAADKFQEFSNLDLDECTSEMYEKYFQSENNKSSGSFDVHSTYPLKRPSTADSQPRKATYNIYFCERPKTAINNSQKRKVKFENNRLRSGESFSSLEKLLNIV